MRFREDRLRQLLKSKTPPWTLGQLHVQARRFRPTLAWRTLSELVNGKRQPTIEVVAALATALDVDPSYLLDLPDEKKGEPYEIIGWRAELEPEVADLAQRLAELPLGMRDGAVGLLAALVELLEQQAAATVSERVRELVAMFEGLDPEDQAVLERAAEEMRAARRATSDESAGARKAS